MPAVDLGSDLLNYIIEQGLAAGDRLPTITELAEDDQLGMSSGKIREQLEVARALGIVDVRSRAGTHLKPYSFTPAVTLSLLFALAQDPRMFALYSEIRTHIEYAFWHEACAVLQEDNIATMRQCITTARAKLSDDWIRIPHDEHRRFHITVFSRLENPFVIGLLEAYWDAYETIHLNTYADYSYLRAVWDYHERILNAICADDVDQAQQLFMEHTKLLRYQPGMDTLKGDANTE